MDHCLINPNVLGKIFYFSLFAIETGFSWFHRNFLYSNSVVFLSIFMNTL